MLSVYTRRRIETTPGPFGNRRVPAPGVFYVRN